MGDGHIGYARRGQGSAGARSVILRDGADGRSGKDAHILQLPKGVPHVYFDAAYVAEKTRTARSLFGGTVVISWPTATGVSFVTSAAFNGEQVMRFAANAKAVKIAAALPESFTFIGALMLPAAQKTLLETTATSRVLFAGYDVDGVANTARMILNSTGTGTTRAVSFFSVPGDEARCQWFGGSNVAAAEPAADVAELWAVRFDHGAKQSRMYHNDAASPIKTFTHAAAFTYDAADVIYLCSVNPSDAATGWLGDIQCAVFFDDTDPAKALSDQQLADIFGDLSAALIP